MVTRLKEVDAVTVGLGWTGAILARELTKAGLNVVSLERGPDRIPGEDFILPSVRDEVKYSQRLELMMDNSTDTITFRNFNNERALPIRRIGAFLPGEGVGGSGIHWGALHWRNLPSDFRIRSAITERYGAKAIPDDMTIQDWPVSYDELEPFYDKFDRICGVSGKAGNLRGKKVDGGNVFEGPRASEYPNAPIKTSNAGLLYADAAKSLGYHPFPAPVAISSAGYTIRRMSRSGPANIAAIAIASPARPTPRRRRIRPFCRCSASIQNSKSVRAALSANSITTRLRRRSPASATPICAPARNTSSQRIS